MKNIFLIIVFVLLFTAVITKEQKTERPDTALSEACLFCHGRVLDPGHSHPVDAFGCYTCHLGNRFSLDKERAHFSMVPNPGDLRVADRTCGKAECHPEIVPRVKSSIMATNRGIIRTLQRHWSGPSEWLALPDSPGKNQIIETGIGVRDLIAGEAEEGPEIDLYRKMCGGCHLWKKRGDRPGEIGRRGGGCTDCHVVDIEGYRGAPEKAFKHPVLTTRIPSDNCVKCHNRSVRIGLSYFGKFESAGYGTPYRGGGLDHRRLSGSRFFINLQADIHFSKASMECIDCHTATGLMGDGKAYHRMRDQVDITCNACHRPDFVEINGHNSYARRLAFLNRKVPPVDTDKTAATHKGTPLYNVRKEAGKIILYRKMDGSPIETKPCDIKNPRHSLPGHERLSCQACHSAWVPQCYGCHINFYEAKSQRDWLSGKRTPGRWKETRSFLRFSKPALGVRDQDRIFPVSPCRIFVSKFDSGNAFKEKSRRIVSMSTLDPHTTSLKSRMCLDCHGEPKTLGLGEGILLLMDKGYEFRPTYMSHISGPSMDIPLDGYFNVQGMRLNIPSKEASRPFNGREINRILRVSPCLGCHDKYEDEIYQDFQKSLNRFRADSNLPCRKAPRGRAKRQNQPSLFPDLDRH